MKRSFLFVSVTILFALNGASCQSQSARNNETAQAQTNIGNGQPNPKDCSPLETRKPNASNQKPAFPEQTRACGIKTTTAFEVKVLAKGLEKPWAVEPLSDGALLVTEKPGRMRIVSVSGQISKPIAGLPAVDYGGQGGLLDVALSPDFDKSRKIFWSFTEARKGGNATSVASGILSADRTRLENVKIIFRALPVHDGRHHFGSRLTFGPDGFLYVTLGERSDIEIRPQAQEMNSHMGKILRLTPEGTSAPGNPFAGKKDVMPEIWTVGHRNVQAAAFDQNGQFWIVEMGPQGGDELNLIQKGKNYGWPLVSFGEEYSGEPIQGSVTDKAGFERPVYYWDPVIAPSGAQFYSGKAFPEWKGNLFVGALRDQKLVRLKIENNKVVGEEHLLTERSQRIRDVKEGPDGALYLVTDETKGELLKIVPKQ
ncbi:PQQ-dependent sugar dehydrogenase [Adhaeribacter terreus]|uniref:PQQ-dependent sugar dehydrogenase n=1 Tax=Adhaeribacter terreus TaxID=529703 RepID=A0ABW0EB91_9BACT